MREKIVIGLDMDGVIVDNTENKIRHAAELGFALAAHQTPSDVIETVVPELILEKMRFFLYNNPPTALEAALVPGAAEGLAVLQRMGIPFFLISRRQKPELARELLKRHGLWGKYFDENNAFFVETAEDKNIKATELGVNVYLDDQPSVLEKLTNVPQKFLMDRFKCFTKASYQRVRSWEDFLGKILHKNSTKIGIFKAYDIRGKYPEEINEKIAARIARVLACKFLKVAPRQARGINIVVGHDARLSSKSLYKAILKGIGNPAFAKASAGRQESGIRRTKKILTIHDSRFKIHAVGMITTPMLYFLVNHFKAIGGIMITASHNPPEFNGMKVVGPKAVPMSGKEIQALIAVK